MTAPIHCRTAASFIATVTDTLGYVPEDSVAVVPLTGRMGGAILRFDLPPLCDRAGLDWYARQVIDTVLRLDGVTAMACVMFVTEAYVSCPRLDVVHALCRAAELRGIESIAPIYRTTTGWGSYDVYGDGIDTEPKSLVELGASGVRLPSRMPDDDGDPDAWRLTTDEQAAALGDVSDVEELIERLLVGDPIRPDEVVAAMRALCGGLADAETRDALLPQIAFGRGTDYCLEDITDELFRGPGRKRSSPLRRAFDPDRSERAIEVLRAAARHADDDERPFVYTSLAWVLWTLGQGTRARAWAMRAWEISLDQPVGDGDLARAIVSLVESGIVAPWFGKAPRRMLGDGGRVDDASRGLGDERSDAA